MGDSRMQAILFAEKINSCAGTAGEDATIEALHDWLEQAPENEAAFLAHVENLSAGAIAVRRSGITAEELAAIAKAEFAKDARPSQDESSFDDSLCAVNEMIDARRRK